LGCEKWKQLTLEMRLRASKEGVRSEEKISVGQRRRRLHLRLCIQRLSPLYSPHVGHLSPRPRPRWRGERLTRSSPSPPRLIRTRRAARGHIHAHKCNIQPGSGRCDGSCESGRVRLRRGAVITAFPVAINVSLSFHPRVKVEESETFLAVVIIVIVILVVLFSFFCIFWQTFFLRKKRWSHARWKEREERRERGSIFARNCRRPRRSRPLLAGPAARPAPPRWPCRAARARTTTWMADCR